MNISDLEKRLQARHIREDMYCLNGGSSNESYCLNQADRNWEVYYSERGQKTNLKTFADENSACEYLYNLIMRDVGN